MARKQGATVALHHVKMARVPGPVDPPFYEPQHPFCILSSCISNGKHSNENENRDARLVYGEKVRDVRKVKVGTMPYLTL